MATMKHRPVTGKVRRLHRPTHRLGERLDDGEPQSAVAAALEPGTALIGTVEAIEEVVWRLVPETRPSSLTAMTE